ncbi:MAG: hypothetical protein ACOCR8_04265 [Desulfosalsimonas sp.]
MGNKIITILVTIVKIGEKITSWLDRKQMIDAGKAIQIKNNLQEAQNEIRRANDARRDARSKFNDRGGLPDDYKYTRKRDK